MRIDITIPYEGVVAALRAFRARCPAGEREASTPVHFAKVVIDDDDAAEELPSHYFEPGGFETDLREDFDLSDLRELIACAAAGNRSGADTYAARLGFSDRERAAVDAALIWAARRAA